MKRLEKHLPSKTNFRAFCHLITPGFSVKGLRVTKIVKDVKFEGVLVELESKKKFPETITHKIFETNSSFHVK